MSSTRGPQPPGAQIVTILGSGSSATASRLVGELGAELAEVGLHVGGHRGELLGTLAQPLGQLVAERGLLVEQLRRGAGGESRTDAGQPDLEHIASDRVLQA